MMEKKNRRLLAFAIVVALVALLACSSSSGDPRFEKGIKLLREQVNVGDDIHKAREEILEDFHSVSEVYDPTGLGEKLWMNVSFGISPSALETFAYSADISLPGKGSPSSAIVVASPQGIVTDIETY